MDKHTLIEACINLVAVNGRPFEMMEDEGFQMLVDPIIKAIDKNAAINSKNIRDLTETYAEMRRKDISTLLKGKLLSIKFDCCTRLDRSILGLNVQFIQDGRLILRTLGMREIYVKHTGQNLKDIAMEILASYGITRDQILSVTTDNGSNMLTAIASMNKNSNGNEDELNNNENEDEEGEFSENENIQEMLQDEEFVKKIEE
jgi:bifunctional polynucleotide phosphatase/kinase